MIVSGINFAKTRIQRWKEEMSNGVESKNLMEIRSLLASLNIFPLTTDLEFLVLRADAHMVLSDYNTAIEEYQRAVDGGYSDGSNNRLRENLQFCQLQQWTHVLVENIENRDAKEIRNSLNTLDILSTPKTCHVYTLIGDAYLALKDYKAAIEAYTKAAEGDYSDGDKDKWRENLQFCQLEQWKEVMLENIQNRDAKEIGNSLNTLDNLSSPKDGHIYTVLGDAHLVLQDYKAAIDSYTKALEALSGMRDFSRPQYD